MVKHNWQYNMHTCKHTYILIYMKWKNRFRCSCECLSSASWNAREMLCTRKRRYRYTAPVLCKYKSVYLMLVVSCLQHILRSPSFLGHFLRQHQPLEEANFSWCLLTVILLAVQFAASGLQYQLQQLQPFGVHLRWNENKRTHHLTNQGSPTSSSSASLRLIATSTLMAPLFRGWHRLIWHW